LKASDYIADFLVAQGVTHVFEMVGGMITHMLDSLHQRDAVRIVSLHHEQSAAFAADAYGRMTGVPGVAMATSGPGAVNLLTGIGSCYFDSSPAVFITGQVNTYELKGDRPVRQMGFQETDIVSMARPITKAAWQARSADEIPELLRKAFETARSGRPGPVLLDVPMDVQRMQTRDVSVEPAPVRCKSGREVDHTAVDDVLCSLRKSRRPLVLAGGGVRSSRAAAELRLFAEMTGVPVVNSLMAVDALAHDDPLRAGLIGTYGNRWANLALGKSDFILVLGSRLDVRQTGSDIASFKADRIIYHVDCDEPETNNRVGGCRAVICDLKDFLTQAVAAAHPHGFVNRKDWLDEIAGLRHTYPDTVELKTDGINPNVFMHQLSEVSRHAAAYVVDVGQNQMWAAQSLEVGAKQRFISSGGMGSMGFSLPAAIGVSCVSPCEPVVMIAGDGGFQCNIQELQSVAHHGLPIKMVVLNNGCLGMVRQFQESYFENRCQSTVIGYSAPDFARVAQGYGIPSATVRYEEEVSRGLELLWKHPDEPALLQVMVDQRANAYPKTAYGCPITEMEPALPVV